MISILLMPLLLILTRQQNTTACSNSTTTNTSLTFYGSCQPKSCQTYLTRITQDNQNVPLNTQGSIQVTNASITVNIQFKDDKTDGTFAIDNNKSCIQSTLIRTSSAFVSLGVNELPIISSYNSSTGVRIWSFTIQPRQLNLLKNSQYPTTTFQFIDTLTKLTWYQGYFAYQFTTNNLTLYTYYFSFKFAVNSTTRATTSASFVPTLTYNQLPCATTGGCVSTIQAKIGFTTSLSTSACSNATSSTIFYLYANIFICYSIPEYSDWTLSNPTIYFTGEGLNFNVTIIASNVTKGVAVYLFQVPFVYSNVSISVSATANAPTSRLLEYSQSKLINIGTPSSVSKGIGCIRVTQRATSCPSQAELQQYAPSAISCSTYLNRIGKAGAGANDIGSVPLNIKGQIQSYSGNIVVTIQFQDSENDGTFIRDNPVSCISSELIRTTSTYVPIAYNETAITTSFDPVYGERNWSFTITPNNYARLTIAQTGIEYQATNYTGYFAYRFNVSGITQYNYYFTFSFKVYNQSPITYLLGMFKSIPTYSKIACVTSDNCVTAINTTIGFSTSPACTIVTRQVSLVLNKDVFLCVAITNIGFSGYVLSSPKVKFTGIELEFLATITENAVSGIYTSYTLKVPFVYSNIAVKYSALANPKTRLLDEHRLLQTATGTAAEGESGDLGCIKVNSTATSCPTDSELATYAPNIIETIPNNTTNPSSQPGSSKLYTIATASMLAVLLS